MGYCILFPNCFFLVKREEKFARIFCTHIFSYRFDIISDEKFIPLNRQKKLIFVRGLLTILFIADISTFVAIK